MSAGAEAATGGWRPTSEEVERTVSEAVTVAAIEADTGYGLTETNISLLEIPVRVPEQPIMINRQPYGFRVNDSLAKAVNQLQPVQDRAFRVDSIDVVLIDSLPEKLQESEPTKAGFDKTNLRIVATLPKEILKSDMSEEELVLLLEQSINKDIRDGLVNRGGVASAAESVIRTAKYGALSVGPLIGEGVGIVTANSERATALAEHGTLGAMVGALAAGAMVVGGVAALNAAGKRPSGKAFRWLYKSDSYDKYFADPLVSILPAEAERPPEPEPVIIDVTMEELGLGEDEPGLGRDI